MQKLKLKLNVKWTQFFIINKNQTMGNVCYCDEINTVDKAQPDSFLSSDAHRSKFYKLSSSEIKNGKNDATEKNIQDRQSAVNVRSSSLYRSINPPSLVRSNQPNHKLIVDPPSEYNHEMFQKLQNMSQVPSDFFHNVNMSVYFKDSKTVKGQMSKKYSFKDPKISIQSKQSRQDDFQNVFSRKTQNSQEQENGKLMPSLIKNQNIMGCRSELRQKELTIFSSQGLKSTSKSMIRPKNDSSSMTATFKNKRDLQTVN